MRVSFSENQALLLHKKGVLSSVVERMANGGFDRSLSGASPSAAKCRADDQRNRQKTNFSIHRTHSADHNKDRTAEDAGSINQYHQGKEK